MAQTIKLRRASGVSSAGKVPTTGQLDLGEVAINTYDGRVFIKQSGSGDDENIRHIVTTEAETTGSINLIGSITASGGISASGDLFANISNNSNTAFKTVVYDPTTGQFFRTGSYGGGGGSSDNLGDHTATTDLNMDGNSIISASAVFVQGAVTSSITGSTRPSDYLPSTIGGTFQPASFSSAETSDIGTTETDVAAQGAFTIGQWPPPNQFVDVPFLMLLPEDRASDTAVRITEISASGDLDANSHEIFNLTFPNGVIAVKEFGNDSNTAGGSTFVPILELDTTTGTFVAENTVNSNANTFAYGDDVGDTPGDWTTVLPQDISGNKVLFTVRAKGLVTTLSLKFKFEYISETTNIDNNHTIGKGFSVGNLPHNYSSIIYNSQRLAPNGIEADAPKGLAVSLASGFGRPDPNSSFIDFYIGSGYYFDGGFDPADLGKIGGIFTVDYSSIGTPGGITLGSLSDKRLKENIKYSDKGLNEIKKIKLRNFNWKGTGVEDVKLGFIAQELHKVIPEAVKVGAKKLKDVKKDPWMVSETKIVPYLVGAIQQQQNMIETLQKEIKLLKKKIK